ncbi:hypothetical protein KO495_16350 [Colwellia sp. D2M02]|uniref:hypothetical protein n=1 Tax=Colwellia sp. D2M02 TaxID=2841562 RepID=UPI001C08FED5|nr:hypothetical protein [Colwellia sp. D2M02]MBU2894876.1 hypothetical protein [Colwellia sp. D2M02]
MKELSQQLIERHQNKLLFIVIWLHVSLLNTINVSGYGPIFLWSENSQLFTVFINLIVASITLVFYLIIKKITVVLCVKKSTDNLKSQPKSSSP